MDEVSDKDGDGPSLSTASLSGNDRNVIEKKVESSLIIKKDSSFDSLVYFDADECVSFIVKHKFERIGLQFPDRWLHCSYEIFKFLEEKTKKQCFILGDTSYGSCCVDEVAGEHANADCIIHFGKACLSPTRKLPIHYALGRKPFDVDQCIANMLALLEDATDKIVLFYETDLHYCADNIIKSLKSKLPAAIMARLVIPHAKISNNQDANEEGEERNFHRKHGREFCLAKGSSLQDYIMGFVGNDDLLLKNLMMTFNTNKFISIDPVSYNCQYETLNVNRTLMKRYYLVQKAKDADVVGIIVGTLGVADYIDIITRLKDMMKLAGKKFYTFIVGKINVAKLANFMEVDIFVLVACPENSLINAEEFYKPIVTPFEMEVACSRAREWTGEYVTDFRELLPGAASHVELEEMCASPEYSFISGELRQVNINSEAMHTKDLAVKNTAMTVDNYKAKSASEFMAMRTWQGLGSDTENETLVTKAVDGRSGISIGYAHEPDTKLT